MEYFKYKQHNKYTLDSLIFNYYWAASAESMNDVFEGDSVLNLVEDEIKNIPPSREKDLFLKGNKDLILSIKNTLGLFCLTQDNKNILMWSHYGDSFKGICIQYNSRILDKIKDKNSQVFKISYVEKIADKSFHDLYSDNSRNNRLLKENVIGKKFKCWEYEQEIRIIHDGVHAFDYHPEAIEAIYFGYKFPEKEKLNIFRALKDQHVKYYKMVKGLNYSINYEELTDISNFTHYLWEGGKLGTFEYNFELENFDKMIAGGKGRITIFTKEIISTELAFDFYEKICNGFFKDIALREVFFKIENNPNNDLTPAYYCFLSKNEQPFVNNRIYYK